MVAFCNLTNKKVGHLFVKEKVPEDLCPSKNHGIYWYCDCDCGTKNVMVPATYLTENGNYIQTSCGCMRPIRHFLATVKINISEDFLLEFINDFERFSFLHKILFTRKGLEKPITEYSVTEYKDIIYYFYNDVQFNKVYDFWKNKSDLKEKTFYDWAKPSPDHKIPKSRGGTFDIENIHFITVFENLAKRDMTWAEWQEFKKMTNTKSDYFIENIMNGGDANE